MHARAERLPDLMMLTQKSVMPLIMLPRSIEDTTSSFFAGSFPNTTAPDDITPPISPFSVTAGAVDHGRRLRLGVRV